MSRERELLKRVLASSHLVTRLEKEIQQLLAQPEQEPVAWMYEWTNETGDIVKGVYVGSHKASHLYELANLVPLYLTPPKREQEPINFDLDRMKLAVEAPVSDVTGEELMKQVKSNRVFYQEGYAQAELDLEREPLSYEHLEALVDTYHGYPMTFGRAIEKAHGITGGGE
jgi:hypothetical protein